MQLHSFSAEKNHNKKEVNAMKYSKPEITKIAEAVTAICLDDSLNKSVIGRDLTNPHQMTPPAYSADED
jgi:predicted transcriptional regulator